MRNDIACPAGNSSRLRTKRGGYEVGYGPDIDEENEGEPFHDLDEELQKWQEQGEPGQEVHKDRAGSKDTTPGRRLQCTCSGYAMPVHKDWCDLMYYEGGESWKD